jgi:hypothetical protein
LYIPFSGLSVYYKKTGMNNSFIILLILSFSFCRAQEIKKETRDVNSEVFLIPDMPCQYPGGLQELYAFFKINFTLDKIDKDIDAKFFVSVVIDVDGTPEDIKILRDPGNGIGEEAVRVLKLGSNWQPAIRNGKAIRSNFTFPITVSLKAPEIVPVLKKMPDVFYNVSDIDVQPEFPGGISALHKAFRKYFIKPKLPPGNKNMKIFISFIVEADGTMSTIRCTRDPGYDLGKNGVIALNAVKEKWLPGMKDGITIRCSYTLPILINSNF